MEAYCMKCKTKREMKDPVAMFNAKGSPVTVGVCTVCGTKLYRMGRTDAHAGLTPPEKPVKVEKRDGKLVVVESPAKAKTVGRYLGKGYTVRASVGHVRDLLKSQLSVDVENNFAPKYRVPNEKKDVVKELKKLEKRFATSDQSTSFQNALLKSIRSARNAWFFMRSQSLQSRKRFHIPDRSTWIWWTPNRRVGFWIAWLDTALARSCGRRCAVAFRQDASNRSRSV